MRQTFRPVVSLQISRVRSAIAHFFEVFPFACETEEFRRILNPTLSGSKSANALIRDASVRLFTVLAMKIRPDDVAAAQLATTEILALPKAGKSNGPDHRVALYSMLAFVPPSTTVSETVMQSGSGLLSKETHDAATSALSAAMTRHLVFLLREGTPAPAEVVNVSVKEVASQKPALRRAVLDLVGSTIFMLEELSNEASAAFAKTLLPGLEASLKSAAASSNVGIPLDGYIPTALLLGSYFRSGKYGTFSTYLPDINFIFLIMLT